MTASYFEFFEIPTYAWLKREAPAEGFLFSNAKGGGKESELEKAHLGPVFLKHLLKVIQKNQEGRERVEPTYSDGRMRRQ